MQPFYLNKAQSCYNTARDNKATDVLQRKRSDLTTKAQKDKAEIKKLPFMLPNISFTEIAAVFNLCL